MLRLTVFLVALCVTVPALARNITSEVQYYKEIEVSFSENAHVCGLKDPAPFVGLAEKRLAAMDVPHNPDGLVKLVVLVTARGSGLLEQSCTAHLGLQLQSQMNSTFPMVFYQTGRVYGELAPTMPERSLKVLGELLDDLAKARKLR